MSELEDIWHNQEQYTPRGVSRRARENEDLRNRLEVSEASERSLCDRLIEARALLSEAVDRYPVETDPKLWTVRVRKWLEQQK